MKEPNKKLHDLIKGILDENKAEEIVSIDIYNKSSLCDYMIIATGTSSRHLKALAEKLVHVLKKEDHPQLSIEGQNGSAWVLLDAGDVIVHLFQAEMRELFNLEAMWNKKNN
jgi:ribosome-associated protein